MAPLNNRPIKKVLLDQEKSGTSPWKGTQSIMPAETIPQGSARTRSVLWIRLVRAYLVKAQIILDGVRRVEDGPTGSDDEDEAVESLRDNQKMLRIQHPVSSK